MGRIPNPCGHFEEFVKIVNYKYSDDFFEMKIV
jgi:hypothetical protein